jgi:hypothetical protein
LRTGARSASGSCSTPAMSCPRPAFLVRRVFQRRIEVVHIGLVVLAMMDFHRLRVDVRFERVEGIRQGWQGVRHGKSS